MVLPTLLVVASILLLIATITKSWRHEKWKSSVLPLLFHPLVDEVRPGVAPLKVSELKVVAEKRQVRLCDFTGATWVLNLFRFQLFLSDRYILRNTPCNGFATRENTGIWTYTRSIMKFCAYLNDSFWLC